VAESCNSYLCLRKSNLSGVACPLLSGSCLKGPGVESHVSLPNAIDLVTTEMFLK
jgi:hypothetical protein